MVAFKTAADIGEEIEELSARCEAIIEIAKAEDRDLSQEEKAEIDAIQGSDGKGGIIADRIADKNRQQAIEDRTAAKVTEAKAPLQVGISDASSDLNPFANIRVPARVAVPSNRKGFKGKNEEGYASGLWLAAIAGNQWASRRIADMGLKNAMSEGTDSAGGFAVPDPLANEIVRLVEEYGVFRRYARVVPMTSDTLAVPRRTAGLTVQYPSEGASITASDITFAQATLTARKYATLSLMSTELAEDAVISMAALIAEEVAYAVAVAEDTNGFTGDGTGSFASITGLSDALAAGSKKVAATGIDTVAELTLASYHAAQGAQLKVPGSRNMWFVNSDVYYNSMAPLMTAAGGNTATDIANGTQPMFLGSPVVFTEVLPTSSAAASSIVAYFGDLSLAATMGSRRDLTIRTLFERYAELDSVGIQATCRSAITVHEVGDGSNGGPVTAVQLAAS